MDTEPPGTGPEPGPAPRPRPFLSILFECCRVYQHVYLNRERTAFVGWCPRCCARVEIQADPGGSDERFYLAR